MTQHNRMQNNVNIIILFYLFNIRSRIGKKQISKVLKMLFAKEKGKVTCQGMYYKNMTHSLR